MKPDERGLALSTDSAEAVTLFDRAVEHYLKFHADTMVLAGRALAAQIEEQLKSNSDFISELNSLKQH